LNVGVTAVSFDRGFLEKQRQKQGPQTFSITVELVNSQNNKVIGRSTFQTSGTYSITNKGLSVSDGEQKNINFTNININDLPPSDDLLAIRIASVNGTAAETAIKNGVLGIIALSKEQWDFYNSFEIKNGVITKYNGNGGAIVIYNIWGDPVYIASIGVEAFANNQLASVTIPNNVTTISSSAFANNKLTNVIIPNSVTSIGGSVFENNQLTSVTISNSVSSIGYREFKKNQLTSITIPNSVTYIGVEAFSENQITNITIGAGVTIGKDAFPKGFEKFYESNKRNAGTYTYDGKKWSYKPY